MSTRRALLIGINDYPLLDHLKYAEQDAVAVAGAIQRHYGFAENEVVLMTSRESGAKFPTQRFIEKQLKMLRDVHHGLELLLIGFWGHGFLSDNRRYLCATDTDEEELARTGIAFESLLSMAAQAGAQNTCIILDCCQKELGRGLSTNTFTESEEAEMMRGVEATARDIVAARRNRGITAQITPSLAVLHSCSAGQRAYEWDDRQHGVFTAHLLDAIEQRLTGVSQLATYVSRHVPITASELSKKQVPCFKLEGGGDIVFEIGEPVHVRATPVRQSPIRSVEDEAEIIYRRMKGEEEATERKAEAERLARERIERERLEREQLAKEERAGERKVLTIGGVEYAFRFCPAGEFMMGSPESEACRSGDETQHRVTLTQGLWMLETQVTQAMWESVMGSNPSYFKGKRLPVEQVSWADCQAFLQKLNQQTKPAQGMKFALPTEAQWEYACRAGATGDYGGTGNLDETGWYSGNSGSKTHAVGLKKPNAWGLYDMHGNVWEWCEDRYGVYPSGSVTDPVGAAKGSLRVIRGGGWNYFAGRCRSAFRFRAVPSFRHFYLGVRLSLVSE